MTGKEFAKHEIKKLRRKAKEKGLTIFETATLWWYETHVTITLDDIKHFNNKRNDSSTIS